MGKPSWAAIKPWKWPKDRERKPSDPLPWIGYDTETCRGDVMLLCSSEPDDPPLWTPTLSEALAFLYDPTRRGVWYNIRYDIECLMKQMPEEDIDLLISYGEVDYCDWRLRYIPGKAFSIAPYEAPHERSYHFDASHFYAASLDAAAASNLGERKRGLKRETVRRLGDSRAAWKTVHRPAVVSYCRRDARLTRDLMERWERLARSLSIPFDRPYSPASVAGQYAKDVRDYPEPPPKGPLTEAAYNAYRGGWFDSRYRGTIDTYEADIRSAYPAAMVGLPDHRASFRYTDHVPEDPEEAYWGFVDATWTVPEGVPWSPLLLPDDRGRLRSPTGTFRLWTTLDEYREISKTFDAVPHGAWTAPDTGTRPLAWIGDLYDLRKSMKRTCEKCGTVCKYDISRREPCRSCGGTACDPRQAVIKVMMNSVYGKMFQKTPEAPDIEMISSYDPDDPSIIVTEDGAFRFKARAWRAGNLFSPVWAAHITARTRLRLWDAVQRWDAVAVATDGVLCLKKPVEGPDILGEWETGPKRKTTLVGNGLYQREGERMKSRGIERRSLKVDDWRKVLSQRPKARAVSFTSNRPLHPGEVLKGLRYQTRDIGRFVQDVRAVDLNENSKRVFPRLTARRILDEHHEGTLHAIKRRGT